MAKNLAADLIFQKNLLSTADAWVHLLYCEVDDSVDPDYIAITNNNEPVTFGGITYKPWPIAIGDLDEDSEGSLPTLQMTVSNIGGEVSELFGEGDSGIDLRGRVVQLHVVSLGQLDNVDNSISIAFIVLSAVTDQISCNITLGAGRWFEEVFPKRTYSRNSCSHVYKGEFCQYSGDLPTCDHTLNGPNGCRAHGNTLRLGCQPTIPRRF